MKKKSFFLTAVATLSLATATLAQTVPNYVPTNGLVGWWPFNGNANDESGNGHNGTVSGAILTTDRFGNTGKAYSFNGSNGVKITVQDAITLRPQNYTLNAWVFIAGSTMWNQILSKRIASNNTNSYAMMESGSNIGAQVTSETYNLVSNINGTQQVTTNTNSITLGSWNMLTGSFNGASMKFYVNGQLTSSSNFSGNIQYTSDPLYFGTSGYFSGQNLNGNLDDIGIWNRALTQQEITDLYNSVNCNNNLAITPQTNTLQIGNTATFNATTSDVNPTFVWQSDLGQGFQTLNNYGNYSGVNTNTLSITNVQLANHNQPIRAISTSGNCVDTSNVAYINIADTCITNVTVYDTITTYISVTDTLFINVNTIGLNNTTIVNTIKVFPNPANSYLNLDFGNFNNLNGYSVKIVNALSQVIYNQPITQQAVTINLSTFGGNGIYFLHVINAQNNTVEIRKIVLQ